MKISRTIKINDTTELTLTTVLSSTELSDAYYEKEVEFDREDITYELDERSEEGKEDICGMKRSEITEEMIECMAYEKRRLMNKYDVDWEYATDQAIKTVLNQEKSKKGDDAA